MLADSGNRVVSARRNSADVAYGKFSGSFQSVVISLFMLLSVFDPADKLLGLKTTTFLLCWVVVFLRFATKPDKLYIPSGLVLYVLAIIAIPVLSILFYLLFNGEEPFQGFQMVKSYLFCSMAILLYISKINALQKLCTILTLLALTVIATVILLELSPNLYSKLATFGNDYGVFYLDSRSYGAGLVLKQAYYATSPMLVIPIAYYYGFMNWSIKGFGYAVLTGLCVIAMFLAGTRNNMFAAIFLPVLLHVYFDKTKAVSIVVIFSLLLISGYYFIADILVLFSPLEVSNSIKIALLNDYIEIFQDPVHLLFGQGLGSYYYWPAKGFEFYVTELTYLEVIRNFGLIMGFLMIGLLMYPIVYAFYLSRDYGEKHIVLAYLLYLVMCISNPNLFSSMGMLILSVLIANIYRHKKFLTFR